MSETMATPIGKPIRVKYRKVYDEADDVGPNDVNFSDCLSENSMEAVSELFPEASIFVLVGDDWVRLKTISPGMDLNGAKLLVVNPSRTTGAVAVRHPPLPPPLPCRVDLGGDKMTEVSNRIVRFFTEVEDSTGTLVPLGTGALIKKNVIVTARHTVVDADGFFLDPLVDGQKLEFIIANPAVDLALLRLPEPVENATPFFVATASKLKVGKSVAVLGYSLEANTGNSEPMLQHGHIVGVSDASGAAVLYESDMLAGIHVGTLHHPDGGRLPVPTMVPEVFEKDTEDLWAAPIMAREDAKAKRYQESYRTQHPGEHAMITPAHHIYVLMQRVGLHPRDTLSRYPAHLARKAVTTTTSRRTRQRTK